ncbi:MAG: C25 family cysteine peptidase [bacterium]|nr:C25 family cysteine peptidase [bacterium]
MKKTVFLILILLSIKAHGEVIRVEYEFQKPLVEKGEYDNFSIQGLKDWSEPGKPVLPVRPIGILIPFGERVTNINFIPYEAETLEGYYNIQPGASIFPTSQKTSKKPSKNLVIYSQTTPYPGEPLSPYMTNRLNGFDILTTKFYPVRYIPKEGKIFYYKKIAIEVITSPDFKVQREQELMIFRNNRILNRISAMVDNKNTITSYSQTSKSGHTSKSSLVSQLNPYDYILITGTTLKDTFQLLTNWKISRGLQAKIFTTDSIYANYSGTDNQEKIRNFIIDCYQTWGSTAHPLKWVTLGGDVEIVPVRGLFAWATDGSIPYMDSTMASDLYYAGLDDNWDADGDEVYGEGNSANGGTGTSGEEADFLAEVAVGRITVNTTAEAGNYIKKVLNYENSPDMEHLNKALFVGESLDVYTWGGDKKDSVAYLLPQFSITRLYERDGTFNDIPGHLNQGPHIINHLGHANSSIVMKLDGSTIDALTNTEYFLLYSQGCITAAFDYSDAVAEHFIFAEGGAFAYIGNTRVGWYMSGKGEGPGEAFDREFLDAVFTEGIKNIGAGLNDAKNDLVSSIGATGTMRWCYFTTNLLGDPETPIITEYESPIADISSPDFHDTLCGFFTVKGSATKGGASGATFASYYFEYGVDVEPTQWFAIGDISYIPVTSGILDTLDSSLLPDTTVTLKLVVLDSTGKSSVDERIVVEIDNAYITSPSGDEFFRNDTSINIIGNASSTTFNHYIVEYGKGKQPVSWDTLVSSSTPVKDGVLATLDLASITGQGYYTIRVREFTVNYEHTGYATIGIDSLFLAGFPKKINGQFFPGTGMWSALKSNLQVIDLDKDGDLEVVGFVSYYDSLLNDWASRLCVSSMDGSFWYRNISQSGDINSSCIVDIDRDGDLEIFVATGGEIHAFDHKGVPLILWPVITGDYIAIADIQNDGLLEIIITGGGEISIYSSSGQIISGWPQSIGENIFAPPCVGDLTGDGKMEIIVQTTSASGSKVYAYSYDGNLLSGWSKHVCGYRSRSVPALGDIDGDDSLEVIAYGDSVFAWKYNGTLLSGFPVQVTPGDTNTIHFEVTLGDFDSNGNPEIALTTNQGVLYTIKSDGSIYPNFPVGDSTLISPIIADIGGDSKPEILASSSKDKLFAFNTDGSLVNGFPLNKPTGDHPPLAVADLDKDSDMEIILGIKDYILAWDIGNNTGMAEWGKWRHDAWNTGVYDFVPSLIPIVSCTKVTPGWCNPGETVVIRANVWDEDGIGKVIAEIESPDETIQTSLTLYDDGAHNDSTAGDGIYGNSWTTLSPTPYRYLVDIIAIDAKSDTNTVNNGIWFTTINEPWVKFEVFKFHGADTIPSPGDNYLPFTIALKNVGPVNCNNVMASIRTSSPYISVRNDTVDFGTILADSTVVSASYSFYINNINKLCPHDKVIPVDLTIFDAGTNIWENTFNIVIVDDTPPEIQFYPYRLSKRSLNPGDTLGFNVRLLEGSGIKNATIYFEDGDISTIVDSAQLYDDGMHNDSLSNDMVYGNFWGTKLASKNYKINLKALDSIGNGLDTSDIGRFTTVPLPTSGLFLVLDDLGYEVTKQPFAGYSYGVYDCSYRGEPWNLSYKPYNAVIWWSGSNSVMYSAFDSLSSYLDGSGKLLITGHNIAEDIKNSDFISDYLGAGYSSSTIGYTKVSGYSSDPISDGLTLGLISGQAYQTLSYSSPASSILWYDSKKDGNIPQPSAQQPMKTYSTTLINSPFINKGFSSIKMPGQHDKGMEFQAKSIHAGLSIEVNSSRRIFLSFGIEDIENGWDKKKLLNRSLAWLLSAPNQFSLLSPSDSETLFTATPDFSWENTDDPNSDPFFFALHISRDSVFNDTATVIYDSISTENYQITTPLSNGTYYWRVMAYDTTDAFRWSEEIRSFHIFEIGTEDSTVSPLVFKFLGNHPNPFSKITNIKYQIPQKSKVKIKLYDLSGRMVMSLMDKEQAPGYYTVKWNAKNIASGVYFLFFEAGDFKNVKKTILLE